MSLIRLFIDEDLMDRQFVRALRARGVDVTTIGEIGTTSFSDEYQLILATEQQQVMYKPADFLNRRIALSLIEASSLTAVNYRKF